MSKSYKAPIIKVEELEKLDVLCLSITVEPEAKENAQNVFSDFAGKSFVFDGIQGLE